MYMMKVILSALSHKARHALYSCWRWINWIDPSNNSSNSFDGCRKTLWVCPPPNHGLSSSSLSKMPMNIPHPTGKPVWYISGLFRYFTSNGPMALQHQHDIPGSHGIPDEIPGSSIAVRHLRSTARFPATQATNSVHLLLLEHCVCVIYNIIYMCIDIYIDISIYLSVVI